MAWRTAAHLFLPTRQDRPLHPSAPRRQGSSGRTSSNRESSTSCSRAVWALAHRRGCPGDKGLRVPYAAVPAPLSLPGLCFWPTLHHVCSGPEYLAGSSGGQAGGHVSLWDSKASMSLFRSVSTSAPATG